MDTFQLVGPTKEIMANLVANFCRTHQHQKPPRVTVVLYRSHVKTEKKRWLIKS